MNESEKKYILLILIYIILNEIVYIIPSNTILYIILIDFSVDQKENLLNNQQNKLICKCMFLCCL